MFALLALLSCLLVVSFGSFRSSSGFILFSALLSSLLHQLGFSYFAFLLGLVFSVSLPVICVVEVHVGRGGGLVNVCELIYFSLDEMIIYMSEDFNIFLMCNLSD